MTPDQLKRKLAAILSADVKGYSRLMGEDEEGTIHTLKVYMEVITGFIHQHRGRVVATGGDSVLAEFASVVDAVRCAVGIQEEFKDRNKEFPEDRRMEFRIGVNLGDVVEDGDNILGDGVNIAARLEGLAEPGGICISGSAYEQIENKIPLHFDYLGEHEVKNIAKPVRIYKLQIETEVASPEKMAFPLPEVPSIAVMPFVNMSGDLNQEFLCDGMTEEIITALSKMPQLFVIARTSTFAYKGKPVMVKQVSEELGVRYVLEGSLQKSGDRIRINAQLIDGLTGYHLWAERFDQELKDLFALQDEITIKILKGVQVWFEGGDLTSFEKYAEKYYKGKHGLDCYLKLMQARGYTARANFEDNDLARRMIEEAITMCPENPMGYISLGFVYYLNYWLSPQKFLRETIDKGIELAQKAISMDDSIASAHALLCQFYSQKKEYDKAIAEGERAVALNPGGTSVLSANADALRFAGRPEEAIPLYQKAIRLNPFAPPNIYTNFGSALRDTGRFAEALSIHKKAIQIAPDNMIAHIALAVTYSMMEREKEASVEAAQVLRINPKFSVDSWAKMLPHKDQSQKDKIINALQKAGLK